MLGETAAASDHRGHPRSLGQKEAMGAQLWSLRGEFGSGVVKVRIASKVCLTNFLNVMKIMQPTGTFVPRAGQAS